MSIVVVIANSYAYVVARAFQAGRLGHVGVNAVAVVAIQLIAVLRRVLLEGCNIRAVSEEDVWASIAVVIEDGHAARHALRRVAAGSLVIFQPEREGLVLEPYAARLLRGAHRKKAGCGKHADNRRQDFKKCFLHGKRENAAHPL